MTDVSSHNSSLDDAQPTPSTVSLQLAQAPINESTQRLIERLGELIGRALAARIRSNPHNENNLAHVPNTR